MSPVSYKKYKRIFINDFMERLEKMNDNSLYMCLRSLVKLCGLLYKKNSLHTKYGEINNIDLNMPSETTLKRDSIADECQDELFMSLYQSGDYERLHELYDTEEIERYIKRK